MCRLTILPMKPSRRHALLTAIATARQWVDDLAHGRAATLAVIARREGIIERHVRLLLAARFRIAADPVGPAGWHCAGQSHRHDTCPRAALVLGRAGAASFAPTLASIAPGMNDPSNGSKRAILHSTFLVKESMHVLTDA